MMMNPMGSQSVKKTHQKHQQNSKILEGIFVEFVRLDDFFTVRWLELPEAPV